MTIGIEKGQPNDWHQPWKLLEHAKVLWITAYLQSPAILWMSICPQSSLVAILIPNSDTGELIRPWKKSFHEWKSCPYKWDPENSFFHSSTWELSQMAASCLQWRKRPLTYHAGTLTSNLKNLKHEYLSFKLSKLFHFILMHAHACMCPQMSENNFQYQSLLLPVDPGDWTQPWGERAFTH